MSKQLDAYTQTSANWRQVLNRNNQKTRLVIACFLLLYASIGLIVDLYLASSHYPGVPLHILLQAILTFKILPIATIIMFSIALISILITFSLHDRIMLLGTEYREITSKTTKNHKEQQLFNIVEEMQIAAGLKYLPKIFIINADYMNAFASGYSEKSAMIAITTKLLDELNRQELQAVIAHELSHIRHMDIKLTLMATVLTNIMVIIIDILFYNAIFSRRQRSEREGSGLLLIAIIILRYALPLINIFLLLYLSRTREYMADAGSVELMRDNQPLATALLKIKENYAQQSTEKHVEPTHENIRREAYIFDPLQVGFEAKSTPSDFFSTHPTIENRLKAIGFSKQK